MTKTSCLECRYFVKKYMDGDADGYCHHFEEEADVKVNCKFFNNKRKPAKKCKEKK